MRTILKLSVILFLFIVGFSSCGDEFKCELRGNINGYEEEKISFTLFTDSGKSVISLDVKEGQFELKGDYPTPTLCYLNNPEGKYVKAFYLENTKMTLTGSATELSKIQITGGEATLGLEQYIIRKSELLQKHKYPGQEMIDAMDVKFIQEHPDTYHSTQIIKSRVYGKNKSSVDVSFLIGLLSDDLKNVPIIRKIKNEIEEKERVEVSVEQVLANAGDVNYKIDKDFKGKEIFEVIYLAAFSNDHICALEQDGTVLIIDEKGNTLNSFKAKQKGAVSSVAIDRDDNIYILSCLMEKVIVKIRGRKTEKAMPKGVQCVVYAKNGEKKSQLKLEGIKTATGAKFIDDNLVVADFKGATISFFDKESGKAGPVIENMRPCCGILDFSINNKNELLVANLGAFKVQAYDLNGKQQLAFGKRGKELESFHGCCNPVGVASLNNGAIVTVEKDPTRIKVYSKDGVKQIDGIQELVKGCSYIPMIVDNKNNLYLASRLKGIVKCVSEN
jgi:hypothetical protein